MTAMQTTEMAKRADYEETAELARVHVEHESLRAAFERLDHQVSRLTDRLVKVLQPEQNNVPSSGILTGVEPKPISPLAARLQDDATHVNRIADQVSELIARLEV